MKTILKINVLEELLHKYKRHHVGNVVDIFPFNSKGTAIRGNFNETMGEYVRNICCLQLIDQKDTRSEMLFSSSSLVDQVMKKIEYEEEAAYDLERFLKQYLFGHDNKIRPIHPYLFNYMPKSEGKGLSQYSQFIKDILISDRNSVSFIFNNKESEDILTELILSNLEVSTKEEIMEYQVLMGDIATLYQEDLLFLSKYKDYFLKSFVLLTHFYTFTYLCQLVVKFGQFDVANYSEATPLYYALEWESINKRRKAADEIEGFKRIKTKASDLFVHLHTMSQLSCHELQDTDQDKKLRFMTYTELKELMNEKGEDIAEQFLLDIKEWIAKYSAIEVWKDNVTQKEEPQNLSQAFNTLFKCLKEGMSTKICDDFGANVEDLGAGVFLKNRGSIGAVFNMSHEMLLLLTAVCVKEERMPLNCLFEEFSKRGVAFDNHSRKLIIELFDSHNILDKKSDSGDAQYVKRIL
ncbi:DNA phosphorothioation-dependent restriction protein DptG [Bacillus wiedmannii]|uniref:DNA phosphorothioation-dependent restriction protein DptG n=1 Tax=Bacillus wiedmannii TaxID=1890302 RepID=UPI000BF07034|nr:DNA phosphorothioation-dependent restriction protein DptG [Bacillus wiedmannii]PEJ71855.1 DNA phosphorothioation-dependent restriction protein DptG [Bacillus wiedmannii]